MNCRPGCGACCISPSITSAIPGMPRGKPAGMRCVQLADDQSCRIFGQANRPAVCSTLKPNPAMCGNSATYALAWLTELEAATTPDPKA